MKDNITTEELLSLAIQLLDNIYNDWIAHPEIQQFFHMLTIQRTIEILNYGKKNSLKL